MNGFTIELASDFKEWQRYNVRLMCELQDAGGERVDFVIASGTDDGRTVLRTQACARLRLFAYVIPSSLPTDRVVGRQPDFAAWLRVRCGDTQLTDERVDINRWGGTSVERTFRAPAKTVKL